MKNIFKVFGIIAIVAVIGFLMAACDNEDPPPDPIYTSEVKEFTTTTGRLTITGLSAYNGKKICGWASIYDGYGRLYAGETAYNIYYYTDGKLVDISGSEDYSGKGTITDGQVTLKVFLQGEGWQSYTGNDQNVYFDVLIFDGDTEIDDYLFSAPDVNFTNGVGSGVLHWR